MAAYRCNIVNGALCLPCITQKSVDELNTGFEARNGDVVVATYPKSGTTWMQQILKVLRSGGVDDQQVTTRFTWIEVNGLTALKEMSSPRFMQTHMSYSQFPAVEPSKTPAKFIYIARNPKDVAVSYYYHTLGFELYEYNGDWNDFSKKFFSGEVVEGDWFEHVLGWWKHKDDKNILFLKYEDMKKDLQKVVMKVSEFIGHDVEPTVIDTAVEKSSFDYMKANPATNFSRNSIFARREGCEPFIRKGIVGDWKNIFSIDQSDRMDRKYESRMTGTGLDFEFDPK